MIVSSSSYLADLMTVGLVALASFGNLNFANAEDGPLAPGDEDAYYTIVSGSIEELPDYDYSGPIPGDSSPEGDNPPISFPHPVNPGGGGGGIGGIVGGIGQATSAISTIVNTGKLIWGIIEANKPVMNVSTDVANAIPQASSTWDSLGGWSAPQTHLYHVTYQNGFGSNVIDFTYRVIFLYGGNVNGKGHFLNGVSIVPANLKVSWGYSFTAKATVPSVTNAGSAVDPVAAMQLQLQWSVTTAVRDQEQTENYYIRGDGEFTPMN